MNNTPTPETDAACPYCKAMPMGMIAKVRWTCGSYGGQTGRSEQCKERANAWEQRDEALRERDEARAERDETRFLLNAALSALDAINLQLGNFKKIVKENTD